MSKAKLMMFVSPRALGKSTKGKLILGLFADNRIAFGDTSSILDWNIRRKTRIGSILQRHRDDRDSGGLYPDELVIEAITDWMERESQLQKIKYFLLSGSPRRKRQGVILKQAVSDARVVHIQGTFEETLIGVKLRQQQTGKTRPEESPDGMRKAWDVYEKETVPGLEVLNGNVLHLSRAVPMRDRLVDTVNHFDIEDSWKLKLLGRLNNPNHPVSRRVAEMDEHHRSLMAA